MWMLSDFKFANRMHIPPCFLQHLTIILVQVSKSCKKFEGFSTFRPWITAVLPFYSRNLTPRLGHVMPQGTYFAELLLGSPCSGINFVCTAVLDCRMHVLMFLVQKLGNSVNLTFNFTKRLAL